MAGLVTSTRTRTSTRFMFLLVATFSMWVLLAPASHAGSRHGGSRDAATSMKSDSGSRDSERDEPRGGGGDEPSGGETESPTSRRQTNPNPSPSSGSGKSNPSSGTQKAKGSVGHRPTGSGPSLSHLPPGTSTEVLTTQETGPSKADIAASKGRPTRDRRGPEDPSAALWGERLLNSRGNSDSLAYGVILDPSADWLTSAGRSRWWVQYAMVLGVIGLVLLVVRRLPSAGDRHRR